MLRIIFLILLVYIGYKVYKLWGRLNAAMNRSVPGGFRGEIDDVMVKDPYCEVYFPKRSGISFTHKGEVVYFCSNECKDRYIQDMNNE